MGMNASHGVAIVGGTATIEAIGTLLTGWNGHDSTWANAAAFLIVNIAAGIGYLISKSRFGQWLFPPQP